MAERFADIFFLIDSGISQADFQQVRSILVRLVNQLNIGASAHRLGLAQYGQVTKVEFLLNAFQTKEETLAGVKNFRQARLQPNQPRNLGGALDYANSNFFTAESGGRVAHGFRQFLVVLSGKNSDDPVFKQSRLIKSHRITVVGMSLGASMDEIRVIATAPYIYDSISNAVPTLKSIFETEEETVTLTGGEKALLSELLSLKSAPMHQSILQRLCTTDISC